MNSIRLKDADGQILAFRGVKFASEESGRVETGRGAIWYELEAFDRDNGDWVLKIAAKRREFDCGEILEFCSKRDLHAIEDFLYDFDPSRILPAHVRSTPREPEHRSLFDAADRAYHAVVRRVFHQLTLRNQKKRAIELHHQRIDSSDAVSTIERKAANGIVNRIKRLFGVT